MKKYLFSVFFLLICFNAYAEKKIVYLDINFLMQESDVGKFINNEFNKINKKNKIQYEEIEKSIKTEEENILKQKNILKEEEFNSKVSELKNKYNSYIELKKNNDDKLRNLRNEAAKKVLVNINDIVTEYSVKNDVSLILEKKNVILGKTDLDITKEIFDLLNKKIKKVEIK